MEQQAPQGKKKKVLPLILALIVIAGSVYGINRYIYSRHHEDTDDAQIDSDISPVTARVGGYVETIRFEDNQLVHAGDTLVTLDKRDLQIRLEQAVAALKNAQAGVGVVNASVSTAQGGIGVTGSAVASARIRLNKATNDYNRYSNLIKAGTGTQQQLDNARAEMESAQAALQQAENQLKVAQRNASGSQEQVAVSQSQVAQRQADVDFAMLQLSYATIISPATGIASRKSVQPGQLVNPGSPICAIVSDSSRYVIANFKETQLAKMREGQEVKIEVDAFPDQDIHGKIYRFSSATGAKFSLLPPDNASGNYVKVVQRVPVKISIGADKQLMERLRPGMSVSVSVKVD